MRIVFIRSNPVSPDSRVEKEVNALIKNSYSVHILAWDRDAHYKEKTEVLQLKDTTCLITRFGIKATFGGGVRKNAKALLLFQFAIRKWLMQNRDMYDCIHACDFDTAYTASKLAKKLEKSFVYDIFDYYIDSFRVPKRLERLVEKADIQTINQAEHTIICTDQRRKQISKASPKNLSVIHNTPHSYSLKPKPYSAYVDDRKLSIVYVGVFVEGRMLKELVDSVSENKDFELHIGGFGLLESYIKEKALEHDNIRFYGKLPYEKTIQLEQACDVMTALYDPKVPNHTYAAPNKFYEALMLGKPLIMAKNTGLDSIVSENKFGKVIDFDTVALKNALTELSHEKTEFKEFSEKMKDYYKHHFSWEEMEKRLISLYQQMGEENEKNNGSVWNKARSHKNVPINKRPSF